MSDATLDLSKQTPQTAEGEARQLLENAEKNFGMVPNMYGYMANCPGLLATYNHGYERFRQQSEFSAVEQEVILLTISRHNECTYCMAAHSAMAKASKLAENDLIALREGRPLSDEKLKTLSDFTDHLLETGGRPDKEQVKAFLSAGYRQEQVLSIVLAMAVKLLSNYTNHLVDTELDDAFADFAWSAR